MIGLSLIFRFCGEAQIVRVNANLKVLMLEHLDDASTLTFQSPSNVKRAAAIAEVLDGEDADVVCLEKAFDGRAREVIQKRLAGRYRVFFFALFTRQ